ncbi:hypothetical protein F5I97DRAFT_387011 [Phlebopus sp. FC_14]|nr:hypothetical protein F5I97DRAFT_387011 [Phlebopus sp. FC_14]
MFKRCRCKYVVAWTCTGIGAIGMVWLWWRWHKNYVWIVNRIFMCVLVLHPNMVFIVWFIFVLDPAYSTHLLEFLQPLPTYMACKVAYIQKRVNCYGIDCGYLRHPRPDLLCLVSWKTQEVHDREVGEQDAGQHGEGINRRISQARTEPEYRVPTPLYIRRP